MEDVLELYAEPYDPRRPVVCFDERPCQMVSEVRTPLPARPGQPRRYDYEYRREGTANLFLLFEPLRGWRHVEVTDRRTAHDFAQQMQVLVDVFFPAADKIRVVLDNLSIHTPWALYETFEPAVARRLVRKLDFHSHPEARKLAQHGRDRVLHPLPPVPRSAPTRRRHPAPRDHTLGERPKPQGNQGRLALHGHRRPYHLEAPVLIMTSVTDH